MSIRHAPPDPACHAGSGARWRSRQTPRRRPPRSPAPPAPGRKATLRARRWPRDQEDALLRAVAGGRGPRRREAAVARRGAHALRDPARQGEQAGAAQGREAAGASSSASRSATPDRLRLVVKHKASDAQAAFRTRNETIQVVNWHAGAGARGTKVTLLQRGLLKLGFATPVTGYFDALTANAVNVFRKTNGLGRDGYAIGVRLREGAARPGRLRAALPELGHPRQARRVRLVAPGAGAGGPRQAVPHLPRVVRASRRRRRCSGATASTARRPGTNSHGMVYSSYFIGGYAIHGYADVPELRRRATAACECRSRTRCRSTTGSTSATRSTRTSSARRDPRPGAKTRRPRSSRAGSPRFPLGSADPPGQRPLCADSATAPRR